MNNSSKFNLNKTLNAILLIIIALIVVEVVSATRRIQGIILPKAREAPHREICFTARPPTRFLRLPRTLPRLVTFPTPVLPITPHGRRLISRTALLAIFR